MQLLSKNKILCAVVAQFLLCAGCAAATSPTLKNQLGINKMECDKTPFEKSKIMIETILADVATTYKEVGGGGISSIKQSRTNTFVVSIAQEQRIDQFTYELALDDDCKVTVVKKESATIDAGR